MSSHPGTPARPFGLSVEGLTRFLKEDVHMSQAWDTAASSAGVDRASDDLVILEEEDLARLAHLQIDSLSHVRTACQQHGTAVGRLLAAWRQESRDPLTAQELIWALTYVMASQVGDPVEGIRALVSSERWWDRASESHRSRFLDRLLPQVAAATGRDHPH